ncbi:WhiB family transcriptional regulator [Streptomyces clavifer]|uniref:WhiB family transcriptional regulator n=1 Tax=Streptomyces clavifer TaxID=68188 RepID=UPI0038B6305E
MKLSTNAVLAASPRPVGVPACKGLDPELFFPEPWQVTPVTAPPSGAERAALQVCDRCPVREWCLSRDLEECTVASRIQGVRGGLRQSDRRELHTRLFGLRPRNGAESAGQ